MKLPNWTDILLGFICITPCSAKADRVDPIDIWSGTECNASVKLTPFMAEGSGNPAVIVCPGGSYFWLDIETEGKGVARWLQSQGISAFVLEYRVAGVFGFITHHRLLMRGNRYPDMLMDVKRSIQLLRESPELYGIDPHKLGVMGFSAGGHLSAMSGIYHDTELLGQVGIKTEVSLKPDFVAPIYPVVSFTHPTSHWRSMRGAIGECNATTAQMRDSLSLERHVRPDMPPTYLMNCKDDPIVHYHNSELLDSAMTAMNVPHRYVQFRTGGHGFGSTTSKTTAEAITWKEDFLKWLHNILK